MFGISGRSVRNRVGEVFASNVSLIGISPKIYCSCHSCIIPITLFFVNSHFQHQSRIASSSNARTALLSHLKRSFNNHTKDILFPFLSFAASKGQLEN